MCYTISTSYEVLFYLTSALDFFGRFLIFKLVKKMSTGHFFAIIYSLYFGG